MSKDWEAARNNILIFTLKRYRDNPVGSIEQLVEYLKSIGYNEEEINIGFKYIEKLTNEQ